MSRVQLPACFQAESTIAPTHRRANMEGWSAIGSPRSDESRAIRHPLVSRTKASEIYRQTGNLRTMQLQMGHTKVGQHSALSRRRA